MDNKYLKVKKESFFQKIKLFFRNLFRKNEVIQELVQEPFAEKIIENKEENKKDFVYETKIEQDEKRLVTLKLQKDYEAGLIKEEDMTLEQVSNLESLYKEQITKLRNDYAYYKKKIINIRKKLATNN